MAGRRAQPISILKQNGRKHLTKAEIEHREKSEIKLGLKTLICPEFIKNNIIAYAKWKEITKIFKGFPNVSSADVGLISRYCMTFSEYLGLVERRNKLAGFHADWRDYKETLPENFRDAVEEVLKFDIDLELETAINKKMDQLIKMEDRLFLNPLAKVKNIPKKQEKVPVDPLAERGFGNV